jgi:hypothetical protein
MTISTAPATTAQNTEGVTAGLSRLAGSPASGSGRTYSAARRAPDAHRFRRAKKPRPTLFRKELQ